MKIYILLILISLTLNNLFAQYTPQQIYIDTVLANNIGTSNFYVKNPTAKTLNINSIKSVSGKFYFTVSTLNIPPNDSVQVQVFFKTNQNVTYRDFLIFENTTLNYSIINYVLATAKYPDTLYKFTQGQFDEALKNLLKTFCTTGYVSLGYNTARDKMFETIDDYNNDDTIECIYSGRKIRAVNRTEAQNQGFDTEHTFPQSMFNSAEPMRSDLFHLYPTDGPANNARSNYPFGFVVSNVTWESGGSKRGNDSTGQVVFEVRNVQKGNTARSMFYFVTKYGNDSNFLTQKFENAMRRYCLIDTVDDRERMRNNKIRTFQMTRNPYIDHPEFIDRIKTFYIPSTDTTRPKIFASPYNITFDTTASNDSTDYYIAVMNYGRGLLNILSVTSSISQFKIVNYPVSVPKSEMRYIQVRFKPTLPNQIYNGTITINNSDSTLILSAKGISKNPIGINHLGENIPSEYKLFQNYPNPFNPVTKIKFQIPQDVRRETQDGTLPLRSLSTQVEGVGGMTTLKILDILGKEVAVLVNEVLLPGIYEVTFDASVLPSGIYYYKLITGDFTDTKKAILLK